jgi:hypothetical protein
MDTSSKLSGQRKNIYKQTKQNQEAKMSVRKKDSCEENKCVKEHKNEVNKQSKTK